MEWKNILKIVGTRQLYSRLFEIEYNPPYALFGKGVRTGKHGGTLIRNTICHSLTALQFPTATKSHSDTSERQAIVRTKWGPLHHSILTRYFHKSKT